MGIAPRRRIYPLRPRWLGTISRYSFSYSFLLFLSRSLVLMMPCFPPLCVISTSSSSSLIPIHSVSRVSLSTAVVKPETVGEKERLTRNERGIAFLHLENEIRIFEASTSSRRMKKEISSFSSFVFLSFWTFHFERFVFLRVPRDKTEYFPEISEISEMK